MSFKYHLNPFWILLPIIVIGCSALDSGTPSESLALEFLETQVGNAYPADGTPKIESFKKTNGVKKTENGVEMYVLEFQSEFVYPKGYMPECVDHTHYNSKCFSAELKHVGTGIQFKPIGTREKAEGKVIFEKAEKGWRAVRLESS